jgi:hypothetical protein
MNMQKLVEWELAGETELVEENLSQCHLEHQAFPPSMRCNIC